jgi:hypothetical protein
MQHSHRSHTEQATHNTDDSEEIISREEGPARKDEDSGDWGEDSAHNE